MSDVVLVYDQGSDAGLGHRRRMEALGAALDVLGRDVRVHLRTADTAPSAEGTPAVVVVDSYVYDAGDRERFPGTARVAIDDLQRPLEVDLLVDPNPGRSVADRARRVLSGPAYALVDPSLAGHRTGVDVEDRPSVLVTMGGSRPAAALAADIAREVAHATSAEVVLVRGQGGEAGSFPPGVREVVAPDGLTALLNAASVVVTAAGVTMLESLGLGRPTIAVVTADNQRRQANGVSTAGAAVVCPAHEAAGHAAFLLADRERRTELALAGPRYVDLGGAARVAREVVALA